MFSFYSLFITFILNLYRVGALPGYIMMI